MDSNNKSILLNNSMSSTKHVVQEVGCIFKAYVTQVTQLTHDVKSIHLHIPDRPSYEPGQFLIVMMNIEGRLEKRPYSFSSPPHWENVELIVKLHEGGKVSPQMFALSVGDELEVAMPYGHFVLEKPFPEDIVFFAFNQGLSAVLGILRYLEHEQYSGRITLLYSNPTREDVVYGEELERISQSLRMTLHHVIWHEDEHIDEECIKKYCEVSQAVFYLHGNPTVVSHWQAALTHLEVEAQRIHIDKW